MEHRIKLSYWDRAELLETIKETYQQLHLERAKNEAGEMVMKNGCKLGVVAATALFLSIGQSNALTLKTGEVLGSDGKVYSGRTCKAVGQGVLSRLVVFANKLFANIAGKSTQSKTDLVVIDSGMGDVDSFRSNWREGNF